MALPNYTNIDREDHAKVLKANAQAINRSQISLQPLANAAGQTLTAAQMANGVVTRSGAAAVSDTTATAAQLVAAMPGVSVGDTFSLTIINSNSGTLTIVAGTGVTLAGNTTIAAANTRRYLGSFTNVTAGSEAVTLQGVYVAAA